MTATALKVPCEEIQPGRSELEFYSHYEWCLNPVLSVRELFQRLLEELNRYEALREDWHREESRINIYLFVCAIACSADDFLVPRAPSLDAVRHRFPWLGRLAKAVQGAIKGYRSLLQEPFAHKIVAWRRQWDICLDLACKLLLEQHSPSEQDIQLLGLQVLRMRSHPAVSQKLLSAHMQLPSGYRAQDLTHHDVVAMARKFVEQNPTGQQRAAVIGLRTAGSYFAPLVKSYLLQQGWQCAHAVTIRPKWGLSRREKRLLAKIAQDRLPVALVDDHPDTGYTLRLALDFLVQTGISPEKISILVPGHPAQSTRLSLQHANKLRLLMLDFHETYKFRFLQSGALLQRLRSYLGPASRDLEAVESEETARVNSFLSARLSYSFQNRLKRVIEHVPREDRHGSQRVVVKSVGWGWLGYHAYVAGCRLKEVVPPVLGLRHGLLFSKWIEGASSHAVVPPVETMGRYIARRTHDLSLGGDPYLNGEEPGAAWNQLTLLLRSAYGPYASRFKASRLRRALARYRAPVPTFVDGCMQPAKFLPSSSAWLKTDFEHHGFGNPSLGAVDPAFDLAAACFEFGLDRDAEGRLVSTYIGQTGDSAVGERLILYKLLYGHVQQNNALYRLAQLRPGESAQLWNHRYLDARNFLAREMAQFCGARTARPSAGQWTSQLFFLDVDGVFDCELLGFPHTTSAGIRALSLLHRGGYSVVLNTGRSLEQVREYCRNYGFAGGIAEFGSVFLDGVAGQEHPLVDPDVLPQMEQCRAELERLDGVFLDPNYRYLLRAYQFHGSETIAPQNQEMQRIVGKYGALRFFRRGADAYVLGRSVNKGAALAAVCGMLKVSRDQVTAIGDSNQDGPMLAAAGRSYAPRNCSSLLKDLASKGFCRVMRQPTQKGLLAAVKHALAAQPAGHIANVLEPSHGNHLLDLLLARADRSRARQMISILGWRHL